jgi:hypothetical protein
VLLVPRSLVMAAATHALEVHVFVSAVVVAASKRRPCRQRWQGPAVTMAMARERQPKRAVTIFRRAIVA